VKGRRSWRGGLAAAAVMSALAVVGCSSVEITLPPSEVIEEITFHPSLGVNLAAMESVEVAGYTMYLEVLEEGEGEVAEEGNTVNVSFDGFLATRGNQFVLEQGVAIILGVGEIPLGLDHAIRGMTPGGQRRVVIPPELGYGPASNGNVPAGSVLVYELELNDVFSNQ